MLIINEKLIILPEISKWDISNVVSIMFLFFNCEKLKSLPDISKWKVNKVLNLSGLFFNCKALEKIPDISSWNIFSNKNSSKTFEKLYLDYHDDILNDNIDYTDKKDIDSYLKVNYDDRFLGNFSLKKVDIKNKNEYIKSLKEMNYCLDGLFMGCSGLKSLPDISKWNISNTKSINN